MVARNDGPSLVELAVKEAVAIGMDTPLRDPVLAGVEKGTDMPVKGSRRLPAAAILIGTSFAIGYMLGRNSARRRTGRPTRRERSETAA